MVRAEGSTINLVLPVGISITHQVCSCAVCTIVTIDEVTILGSAEHIKGLLASRKSNVSVVAHVSCLTFASLLRGDDDDTVRTTATIDGSRRSVLQDGEALDVLGIHHRKGIGQTLDTLIVHSQTVDDNQRVVGSREGGTAADADCGSATRGAAAIDDTDTSNLALNHVLGVSNRTMVLLVGLQGADGTCKVMLLHGSITDDNHILQHLGVLLKSDVDNRANRNGHCLETHERNSNLATLRCRDREITVEVCRRATLLSYNANGSTKDRFAGIILNITFHRNLCKGTQGDE